MKIPRRCVLIGLDGAFPKAVQKYVEEGVLPNIAKLLKNGAWSANCLCPIPTITPPNWTTIATGATVGTHGITCFHLPEPGGKFDEGHPAFDSREVNAEFIWESAEKIGLKTLVCTYPTTWPSRLKLGYQINGAGGETCDIRDKTTGLWGCKLYLPDDQLYSTEPYPEATPVEMKETGKDEFQVELPLENRRSMVKIEGAAFSAVLKEGGVLLYFNGQPLGRLETRKLSQPFKIEVQVGEEKIETRVRFKLLECDPREKRFRLYRTNLEYFNHLVRPGELGTLLKDLPGHALSDGFVYGWWKDWLAGEDYLEFEDLNRIWIGEAIKKIHQTHGLDLVFLHLHTTDNINHTLRNEIEGSKKKFRYSPAEAVDIERKAYIILDRFVGEMVETFLPEETLFILVSDHGSIGFESNFRASDALKAAGLLVTRERKDGLGEETDWNRSRAIPQRADYIFVNLKGRNPTGIVDPDDYGKVQDAIISALYDYTDRETGKKPVALALKKADALLVGLKGETVGDVVYCVGSGFGGTTGGVHGTQIPTAVSKAGEMRSLLLFSGPGIKKGYTVENTVGLEDIVPTICHLMCIPVPAQAEGGIIYQALEDPDYAWKRCRELEKNYERLERAYNLSQAQTHAY